MTTSRNKIIIATTFVAIALLLASTHVQAQLTSFSIESVGSAIYEFGTYTGDSTAAALIQVALVELILAYAVATMLMVIINWLANKFGSKKIIQQTTVPELSGKKTIVDRGLTFAGLMLAVASWVILYAKRYEIHTIIFIFSFAIVLTLLTATVHDYFLSRHSTPIRMRISQYLFQLAPAAIILIWIQTLRPVFSTDSWTIPTGPQPAALVNLGINIIICTVVGVGIYYGWRLLRSKS